MARSPAKISAPRRMGDKREPRKGVVVAVRATQEQKDFLSRLGGGSVSRGFDRAVAVASDRHVLS